MKRSTPGILIERWTGQTLDGLMQRMIHEPIVH